jgi:high affinity Mn2+ porin
MMISPGSHQAPPTNALTLTADYQLITNPAYNADRGPVHVFSGRFHGEF